MTRLARAWRALDADQRLAGIAALALFVAMFLPWYQQNAVVTANRAQPLVSRDLNAFAVFSFVEAAVLLVAAALLGLLFARAEHRSFHLPGTDGAVVLLAGVWTALLLILRLFDKPGISSHGVAANVGIQWGIFFALAAAGLIAYAGSRMRASARPEPPLIRRRERPRRNVPRDEDLTIAVPPPPPIDTAPASTVRSSSSTPPDAPSSEPRATAPPSNVQPTPSRAVPAKRRPPRPPAPHEQLSLEDSPGDRD